MYSQNGFKELVRLAEADFVEVFLTAITKAEVEAHVAEQIHEAALGLKRFRKERRVLRNLSACDSFFEDFDEKAAVAEVQKKF